MFKRKLNTILPLMLAILLAFPINAFASGTVLSIKAPSTKPKAGESFKVTAELSGNPGFCAIQYTLQFTDSIDCESIEFGSVASGMLSADNPDAEDGAIIAAAATDPKTGNGIIATYSFKALEDVKSYDFVVQNLVLVDEYSDQIDCTVSGAQKVYEETQKETGGQSAGGGQTTSGGTASGGTTTVVAEKATEAAIKQEVKAAGFTDTNGHWAESFIAKAVEKGLFKGNDDGSFGPDKNITRAQFVTVLYRMAGSPEVSAATGFKDISDQITEFQKAIAWAYSKGYVNGTSDTTFEPSKNLTRQEAMKILFGYSGGKSGGEVMYTQLYDSGFSDSGQIASWAKAGMYWCYYNEIVGGTSKTTLGPTEPATRAQLAKILVNYSEKYK